MKAKLVAVVALALCVVSVVVPIRNSYANDLTTYLSPGDDTQGRFNAQLSITLDYPSGSPIAQMIQAIPNGVDKVTCSLNGTAGQNPSVDSAITAFNRAMVVGNSTVHVQSIQMSYDFKIQSVSDTSAILSYNVRTNPELQKYIITTQGGNTIMDLAWRKVSISEPINVDPSLCNLSGGGGKIDLNHPAGILQAKYPDLLKKFDGTSAAYIFTLPILQYNTFNVSMDRWHFLFDPSGSLVQTQGTFTGNSTTKAVSVYALGESSFREGTFNPETHDESLSIDGGTVKVHSEQPPPSGQIQIAGYAKLGNSAGNDIAIVSNTAPPDAGTASGSFPFQVLMVFGGMMGAIAIFILIKARK